MSAELIVITYPNPEDASRVVEALRKLQSRRVLELADLEFCSRDADGNISFRATSNRRLHAAALGAFWGTFLGRCFDRPLLGAGLGAAGGALASRLSRSEGIDDDFVRELTAKLAPGSSVVFALVTRYTPGKVLPMLGQFGGTVLHTSLPEETEDAFQQALDAAHQHAVSARKPLQRNQSARRRRVLYRP
jgi:uncharacterized membrane protein